MPPLSDTADNPASETPPSKRPNAFSELMNPKKPKMFPTKQPTKAPTKGAPRTNFRDNLGPYTDEPESYPSSRVVQYDEKFVFINDLYPKATFHLLILLRDDKIQRMHPLEAFKDPAFLTECKVQEAKARDMVAHQLHRRFGEFSAKDKARRAAMESENPPDELPPGRDWSKEVISGIHATPSMNDLHIHVLSRDMVSEPMKKRNHYQSFTTDFLIPLDAFPLAKGDPRYNYQWKPEDMICWRCGLNFTNQFAKLKAHLEEELEEWKKE